MVLFFNAELTIDISCFLVLLLGFDLITNFTSLKDLQLDVKGCHDVYASFDKYVEIECLEGDNKYHAEQLGLQVFFYACR